LVILTSEAGPQHLQMTAAAMRDRYSMEHGRSPRAESLNVASVTMSCHQDPDKNLLKIVQTIHSIMGRKPDTQLIVFGEMTLGWYDPAEMPEYHREISLHVDHDSLGPVSMLASHYGIYICIGISENDGGIICNSLLLFDRRGDPKATHRKKKLSKSELACGYHKGPDDFTMTTIHGLRTAIASGRDLTGLSTIIRLRWKRPDLIVLPLADESDPGFIETRFRGRLFDAAVVSANRFGREDDRYWEGHAAISSPWGRLLEKTVEEEEILFEELRFGSRLNLPLRIFRKIFTRVPIPFVLLGNWKRLRKFI